MIKPILSGIILMFIIYVPATQAQPASTNFIDVCNVKTFGAQGDGTADDTQAIASALTAANTTGCQVYFPAGTYMVSQQFQPAADVTMIGAGSRRSIVKASGAFPPGMAMILMTAAADRVAIRDLGFTSVNAVGSGATFSAIETLGSEDVTVERCWFDAGFYWSVFIGASSRNCGVINSLSEGTQFSHNVEINDSSYCYVVNSHLKNSRRNGIELYLNTPGELQGNRLIGNLIEGATDHGILTDGDRYTTISGNTIRGSGLNAMYIRYAERLGLSQPSVGGHAVGNTLIDNGGTTENALVLATGSQGWTIQGNSVTGAGNSGIWVGGMAHTISGNTVIENRRHGIFVSAGKHTISSNICINNSTLGPGVADGIRVESSDGNTITGNRCTDTRAVKLQAWGVLLYQSNNNIVTNNSLSGNRSGSVYSYGTTGNVLTPNN
ncbi:MAG TPA: glycosyl hydrolase family 28-related protein [Pyrinomonadaceae bacterium]|nr:glycosyl hydrolase family 28-related protein [Pyrinomonadaceae bacterium]